MTLCPFCGEPETIDLSEAWGHEFMLETCCEARYDALQDDLQDDDYRDELMAGLTRGYALGELRRVPACDGQFLLDYKLDVRPIPQARAKAFVLAHHAHNKPPAGWRYGAGIWNGSTLIGVVMVGRPVARLLDAATTVEVNRLCVRRDLPAALRWNACSQLYGWAAREAKARGFARIITYTLDSEAGTTLRAAGWAREGTAGGGSWSRVGRERTDSAPTVRKVRWQRQLRAEQFALAA